MILFQYLNRKWTILTIATLICSGCVLTNQIGESRKSNQNPITETVQEIIVEESEQVEENVPPIAEKKVQEDSVIWYHPNPWWKIKTLPFKVSADSFEYRMMRPQYSYPEYIHTNGMVDKTTWTEWMSANKMYNDMRFTGHAWGAMINANKAAFTAHPEYLAEIDGARPGIGKAGKFCVTNASVQQLYADFIIQQFKKDPERKFASIEPSDGAGFCTCAKCKKVGAPENQVFFFANQVAEIVSKSYPDKYLNLYAYNLHSETPPFKLHKNILVAVIPTGFQTLYPHQYMMLKWAGFHKPLYWRDYFGIPQWTSDLPRINVETFLTRTNMARRLGYEAIIMESGINLNAALLSVLFNAIWMNPALKMEDLTEKFVRDCFPQSYQPMKRLFTRWHNTWLKEDEVAAALFDLKEASQLATQAAERERLNDIKAYVHYIALLHEWMPKKDEPAAAQVFYDYIFQMSTRNLIHTKGILRIYNRHLPNPELAKKYHESALKADIIPFLDAATIEKNFQADLKKFPPVKIDFTPLYTDALASLPYQSNDYSKSFKFTIRARQEFRIVTDSSFVVELNPGSTTKSESAAFVTIANQDYSFAVTREMNSGDKWKVNVPKRDAYIISMHRLNSAVMDIKGRFIPILGDEIIKKSFTNLYTFRNGEWKKIGPEEKILNTTPHYFLLNR